VRDFLCPSVIGRDDELAKLADALHDAAESRGSAMFLVGEAGIGKSRLVREAIGTARDLRLRVLGGHATQSSGTIAFRPLSEALFSYFRDQDLPDASDLEPFRDSLARLVPQWRQGEARGADDSVVMLAEAILRLLRVVAGDAGCLLVLEDLHWADPETLSIVEYLSENLASEPVLLLCSVRSERGPALDLVDGLAARRAVTVANLARLSPADTAAMGRACLSVPDLPDQVRTLLEVNADGLPFFVEELLAGAVDAGALVPRGKGWVIGGPVEPQVPRTFVDSVDRRLASLGDAARILVAAAVLGRRFDWAVLCDVTGEPPDVVLDALRAGVDAQLLVADPASSTSMEFRHALTRDAVVGRLLAVEWAEIARRALEAIMAAHPDLPGEWCDLGARLAERAGDSRAAALLVESGRRSLARGALASAEDAFDRARGLAVDPEVRADAIEALCETLALAGKVDDALEVGQGAARALDLVAAPPQRLGLLQARLASAAAAANRWDVAEQHLALARDQTERATEPDLRARVQIIAAQISYGRGELERASELAQAVLVGVEGRGLHELTCEALVLVGHCARVSDIERAEHAYLEAVRVAERNGLEVQRARALFEVGTIDFMALRPPTYLEAAREVAAATGALATVAQIDMHLGAWFTYHFDTEHALEACRRSNEIARRLHMHALVGINLIAEAAAYGRRGSPDRMQPLLDEANALAGDEPSVTALMWGLCRAELSLIDEKRRRGLSELDTMMNILRQSPASPPIPQRGLWALLRAVENLDGDAACAELRASGATAQQLNLGFAHYADAVLAGRARRSDDAEASFAAGSDALADLTWYRHFANRLVAEAAIADGWGDPPGWLMPALIHFEEHGQDRLVAACRSLLGKAGAPIPRRGTSSARIPLALRELGVTEREAEVLTLLGDGLSNKEIASRLYLSPRTVERHIANLTVKTDVRTRSELIAYAARAPRS
jgi:DNA-binding CsgD family transcriptional regulator/tetratricopeptide (TPR) repeat protein